VKKRCAAPHCSRRSGSSGRSLNFRSRLTCLAKCAAARDQGQPEPRIGEERLRLSLTSLSPSSRPSSFMLPPPFPLAWLS
jgi:hypothetical protein